MKISFVISNCPRKPTGGHKIIFEYVNYLAKNHDVSVYFGYDEGFARFHIPVGLKRFLAKISTKYFRPKWFKFTENVKKNCIKAISNNYIEDADIVIATDVKTAYPVFALNRCKGEKYYFIQDFENWCVSSEYVENTYKLNMKKIVVSNWLKEKVLSINQNDRVYCVSNSINTDIFKVREEMNRSLHSIIFQYRSNEAKGCRYAIEVIDKLKEVYKDLEVTIISNEQKNNTIPEWCRYYFNVSPLEVSKLNNQAKVFICTSVEEGFGLPGLEAMACGCAVVSTNYKGVYEYAVDGENALLSPIRNVDLMVNNIIKLFEDEQLRKKIIEKGIKTGKERSLDKSAQKFEKILVSSLNCEK